MLCTPGSNSALLLSRFCPPSSFSYWFFLFKREPWRILSLFFLTNQSALLIARVYACARARGSEDSGTDTGRCSPYLANKKCMCVTNPGRQRAQIFIFFFSQTATAHICWSHCTVFSFEYLIGVQESARAHTQTHPCTHAQGSRDSAAVLITPNGSIRHTVMINPVESLPLHSVTCWCQHHLPLPCLHRLTGGPPWPLWPAGCTRSPEWDMYPDCISEWS